MNSSPQNRYEVYGLDPNWNRSQTTPIRASDLINVESCIRLIKFIYGEPTNGSLSLPQDWSRIHYHFLLSCWIEHKKLNNIFKIELGINFPHDSAEFLPSKLPADEISSELCDNAKNNNFKVVAKNHIVIEDSANDNANLKKLPHDNDSILDSEPNVEPYSSSNAIEKKNSKAKRKKSS